MFHSRTLLPFGPLALSGQIEIPAEPPSGPGTGTHIQKSTSQNPLHSSFQIRILTHNRTILPTQLHKTRLEILSAGSSDLATDGRAAREVNLADGGVLDHGVDDVGGIGWLAV
jgi:hypothetical protein